MAVNSARRHGLGPDHETSETASLTFSLADMIIDSSVCSVINSIVPYVSLELPRVVLFLTDNLPYSVFTPQRRPAVWTRLSGVCVRVPFIN
jgi:hypothetical protein